MPDSATSFHHGDVITGEPHLYCARSLAEHRDLQPGHDPREVHLRAAIGIHLPRVILVACAAAAVLFGFVAFARAEISKSATSTGWMTPECAERDLKVTALIEERGDRSDVPASVLGEIGLAQLDARLTCLLGGKAEAVAKYDAILNAPNVDQHAKN